MIVRNEAAWIARSLASVRALVDEMIIVDTGSTDATASLAAEAGARVVPYDWQDDFAAARNVSLAQATKDWILVLDADEALDIDGCAQLRAWAAHPSAEMAELLQTTYSYQSSLALWQPNRLGVPEAQGFPGYLEIPLVRFFRNSPAIRFEGMIHEMVLPTRRSCARLPVRLHHYGQVRAEGRQKKSAHYYRLVEQKYRAAPHDAQVVLEYAIASYEEGRLAQARAAFGEAVEKNPAFVPARCALAQLALQAGDDVLAEAQCRAVLQREAQHVTATILLCQLLVRTNRVPEAGALLCALQPHAPRHPELLKALGSYYALTGMLPLATTYLRMAQAENPRDPQIGAWLAQLGHTPVPAAEGAR